uniref:Uncharacterized LOC115371692 n=1 Tax=Myripristis murdjan TaxID=586833 RepID=A0A668AMA7_9TELE
HIVSYSVLKSCFSKHVWWRSLFPLCYILSCVQLYCASSQVPQKAKYNYSLRLTRLTRTGVQRLLNTYVSELDWPDFENRSLRLSSLPLLSTEFDSWLRLTDWERLRTASWDLHTYWDMLERKRKQLEGAEGEQMAGQQGQSTMTLLQSIKNIQLDLRDLMKQVSFQMSHMNSSSVNPTASTPSQNPPPSYQPPSNLTWASRVEGYIILRDLNLYLIKLARDFLLLASKIQL